MFARRTVLGFGVGAGAMLAVPVAFARAATDRRFVFILQRGAADGLSTVIPHGDPAYASARGALAVDAAQAIRLDAMFALHPSLVEIGRLHAAKQALFVHAVASPYRERSHFDAQNMIETGGALPYAVKDGWLNRLVALLPPANNDAIAFAPTVSMALRGAAQVTSYAPSALRDASDDLLARVGDLYADDAQLGPLWTAAMAARGLAGTDGPRQDPASLGRLASTFLARADGPRIAMIETGGWDTHSGQAARLGFQLRGLDAMIAALRTGLGPVWAETVVLVATEFGRTVAPNGTGGTDHGTASAAMLLGGAVNGGRVLADWPGLGTAALHEGRDLRPTTGLDALFAGAAAETFALDPARVAGMFARASVATPITGLLRA